MRKLVVSEFVSLDGVIENPLWTFPYWNDEIANFKVNELFGSDSLLLGRVTYQGFAQSWPTMTDEQGYAERMNGLPKAVVTSTLDNLEWNNATAIQGDLACEVNRLKQEPGQDILLFGSGKLVQALIEKNLVDQYNLLIYPVVLGKGQHLFEDGCHTKLKLVECKPFNSGVVGLIYQPDCKI
jgi:dihydrofolate reductase